MSLETLVSTVFALLVALDNKLRDEELRRGEFRKFAAIRRAFIDCANSCGRMKKLGSETGGSCVFFSFFLIFKIDKQLRINEYVLALYCECEIISNKTSIVEYVEALKCTHRCYTFGITRNYYNLYGREKRVNCEKLLYLICKKIHVVWLAGSTT